MVAMIITLSHCYENRYILFHSRTIHTDVHEAPGIAWPFSALAEPYLTSLKDKLLAYNSKISWPEDGNSCFSVLNSIWTRLKWCLSPLAYIARHTSLRSDEPYRLYLFAISDRNYNTQVDKLLRNNVGHFGQRPTYNVYTGCFTT